MTEWRITIPTLLATGEQATFGFHISGTGTDAAMVTAMNTFMALLQSSVNWKVNYNTAVVQGPAIVQAIDPATDKVLTTNFGSTSVTGTGSSFSLPPQCAPVVTFRTAKSGPRYRGRMYLPPFTVASCTVAGRLVSTGIGNTLPVLQSGFNGLITAGFIPVVRSRKFHTSEPITSLEIGDVIDTQRRRRNAISETRQSVAI